MAIYNPPLKVYAPFYIQGATDATATDIRQVYGVTIRRKPYPAALKVKEPYRNDWKDRDGDDEYLGQLFREAFTYTIEAVMFTKDDLSTDAKTELAANLRAFQKFLLGGALRIYDDSVKFGFRNVRLVEFIEPGEDDFKSFDGHCRLVFKFTLKINDPSTAMVYDATSGAIIEDDEDDDNQSGDDTEQ